MTRARKLGQVILEATIAPGNLVARKTRFTTTTSGTSRPLSPTSSTTTTT